MTSAASASELQTDKSQKISRALSMLALIILAGLTLGRVMINEPTFNRGPIAETGMMGDMPVESQIYTPLTLLRAASAIIILLASTIWAAGGTIAGKLRIKRPGFFVLVIITSAVLFASAHFSAQDKRQAFVTALEQSTLLFCCVLAGQLVSCGNRRRLVLMIIIAMAAALGTKALHQIYVEIPEQVKFFNENRQSQLDAVGITDNSPESVMLEARITEKTAKGFFSLANIYGSLMVLLATASFGIALDKLRSFRAMKAAGALTNKKGEIPLPLAACLVALVISLLAVYGCLATQSIGAAASCGFAFVLAAVAAKNKRLINAHRGKLIVIGAALLIIFIGSVITVGIVKGSLPSRTLQVRWEYWTGSMELLKQHLLLGVGPGEFSDAYLAVRQPGAEEGVKNPHNIIAQTLAEYGLAGAACYLAAVVWILLALCKRRDENLLTPSDNPALARRLVFCAFAAGMLGIFWRILTSSYPNAASMFVDNFLVILVIPTAIIAAAAATARDEISKTRMTAIFISCGLGGFMLHNLSDFAIFSPPTAMAFFFIAGSCMAAVKTREIALKRPAAIAATVAIAASASWAIAGIYLPVRNAERLCYMAAKDISSAKDAQNISARFALMDAGLTKLASAADSDPLDAKIPADIASLADKLSDWADSPERIKKYNKLAEQYVAVACQRDPSDIKAAQLNLQIAAKKVNADLLALAGIADDAAIAAPAEHTAPAYWNMLTAKQLNALAMSEFKKSNKTAAITMLEFAVNKFAAEHPTLQSNLGDLYWLTGKVKAARQNWQEFYNHITETAGSTASETIAQLIDNLAARDPQDNFRRLSLAQLSWRVGLNNLSAQNAAAARDANDALYSGSVLRFSQQDIEVLEMTIARAEAVGIDSK